MNENLHWSITENKKKKSKTLDLRNSGITGEDLKHLAEMTWLEELNLRNNDLDVSVSAIYHYRSNSNPLQPLASLQSLRRLYLGNTNVHDITPLGLLKDLEELELLHTNVSDIEALQGLIALRELDLSYTHVTDLTPLKGLISKGIEVKFGNYSGSDGVFVEGCGLTNPPIEIAKQSNSAILNYWRSLEVQGDLELNEAKIILLGIGASGKTSLVRRLFEEPFDKSESQTNGISVRKKTFVVNRKKVLVRFWDFGGQEIMHATHKFFLTHRAIYLVVLDARKDDLQAEYWLDHVKTYGGNSSVFVVINQVDENPSFAINERGLRDKYGSRILGFHRISCKKGTGISTLQKEVLRQVGLSETTQTRLPQVWRKLKDRIESMAEDYVSFERYRAICDEEGLTADEDQQIMLKLLHDLGIALDFADLRSYNTSVLNPEWLTNAVYRLINAWRSAESHGEFAVQEVGRLLNDPKYTHKLSSRRYPIEKYGFIAESMACFELCYLLPDQQKHTRRYLIPELLPAEEPELNITDDAMRLELEYAKWPPPSVLPRFIVKMHPWVVTGKAWRTGVFIAHDDWQSEAVIKLDRLERRIRIWVSGKEQRKLMEFIRDTFNMLNGEFSDLQVKEQVPLDGGEDFVTYQDLVNLEVMGVTEHISPKLKKRFSVTELLNGLEADERRKDGRLEPVRIFISYPHKILDKDGATHKNNLKLHLSPFIRSGAATVWDDGLIVAGEEWEKRIWQHHREADIILCLVSANFIASDYCYAMEFKEALKAREEGTKDVIPILVEDCHWKALETLSALQNVPETSIADFPNENKGWADVARSLDPVIQKWIARKHTSDRGRFP